MNAANGTAALGRPGYSVTRLDWIQAWRGISREECVGAALLGVAVYLPTLFQLGISPIAVGWPAVIHDLLNTEISAFALLLALVVADQAVDRGAPRVPVYAAAVLIGAIVGVFVGAAHSHLLWDGVLQPNAVMRSKIAANSWVFYTRFVYRTIEWTLVGGLATYVYVDRRDARRMVARLHEAGMRHSEQARTMFESELQTLQARVEPGLLFQTLSRVRDLYDVDAHAADAMLDELILYLRAAMPRMRDTAAPLAQELELARSWITIVDRHRALTATFECDASAGAARMPSMLLLPLVSALLAQRYHPQRAATLRVGAALARSRLCVTIVLDPAGEGELPRLPLIDPLCERLAALFGTQASLVLSPVGGRIEALLEMPHEATDRPDR